MWGVYPHLAYELFNEKKDGWKLSMKYFQNVVDIVRDLMSPIGTEKQYKEGMRKDKDGFTDILWCQDAALTSWDELRTTFLSANGRKAIAPTQFNPQSTRGHCIMTLDVVLPDPENPASKKKGRVYVCDLAGTEPAGDVYYAEYKKTKQPDGSIENLLVGPHKDTSKTKNLQNQGKKINLSLSEMAQFFMKMAQAIKKKKLKAGQSIPGCNSYFLCRYLKDTMLQARTYLFCAIRPEVKFHPYTFSTLNFAKNASVIKLQPKKATVAATPKERALMAQLEKMKLMMEQMQASGGGGGGGGGHDAELQAQLDEARAKLQAEMDGGSAAQQAQQAAIEKQKREYGRRGIQLAEFDRAECKDPYFLNQDLDEFRSARFMFVLSREETVFGTDIKPMDFAIVDRHCVVRKGADGALVLIGGAGETYHNGAKVESGAEVALSVGDRVVMASVMMLLYVPGKDLEVVKTTEEVAAEYRSARMSDKDSDEMKALQAQKDAWEKQKADMEAQMEAMRKAQLGAQSEAEKAKAKAQELAMKKQMQEEEAKQVESRNRSIMLDLIPKVDEACRMLKLLNRGMMQCEAMLRVGLAEDNSFQTPEVKVKVENAMTDDIIYLDPYEFENVQKVMRNEIGFLAAHFEDGSNYQVSDAHDPMNMLYDPTFELGTAVLFNEPLLYFLPAEAEDKMVEIKNVGDPRGNYGQLECMWSPLTNDGEPMYDAQGDICCAEELVPDVADPADLIGKSWCYKLEIFGISKLPVIAAKCYCQYTFDGQTFTTEVIDQHTDHPRWDYSCVHRVDQVTQEFVDTLQTNSMNIHVYVSPYIAEPPADKINTQNAAIAKNMGFSGTFLLLLLWFLVHFFFRVQFLTPTHYTHTYTCAHAQYSWR